MIFSTKPNPPRQRAAGGAPIAAPCTAKFSILFAAVFATLLLASCGGGTSQVQAFVPQRLLVFGDDTSTLTQNGRRYGVNGIDTNGAINCALEPIWVQSVANLYGFVFAECNPSSAEVRAFMRAFAGAKVGDVAAQVEAQVAAGGFRDKDLATVLAGTNDILELYNQYPGRSFDDLQAEARSRGATLAAVVNRLVGLGVKVVVSDVPDLGLTPFAIAQKALDPTGTDRAALMSKLTTAFNEQLGVKVVLDGRFVGLVQAQLRFQAVAVSPGSFGLANIVTPICTVPLPNCSTATLIPSASTTQYLWADDTHLSTGGHSQLAALAIDRAQRNPF